MGYKSGRSGQHLLRFAAAGWAVAALGFTACAPLQEKMDTLGGHFQLARHRDNLAAGSFATVVDESRQVLEKSETRPPADVALYALGEVYANHAYQERDYELSRHYFEKLIENFPNSPLADEARTFVAIYGAMKEKEESLTSKEEVITTQEKEIADLEKAALAGKHDPVLMAHRLGISRDFEGAAKRNRGLLAQVKKKSPGDVALYNLGLIYAHKDNPSKDYKKSRSYFQQLTREFPSSPLADEARVWLGLFEVIEKMQQIDIEIEQQKEQLGR